MCSRFPFPAIIQASILQVKMSFHVCPFLESTGVFHASGRGGSVHLHSFRLGRENQGLPQAQAGTARSGSGTKTAALIASRCAFAAPREKVAFEFRLIRRNTMRSNFVRLVLTAAVVLSMGTASVQCEAADVYNTRSSFPSERPCVQKQDVSRVARSVNVTVPVPQPPRQCLPPGCPPSRMYCPPPVCAPQPVRAIPVSVDIAVRPESCDQRRPVPVVYRDPGFLAPLIKHSVGFVGATIAAPFRVAEMLCPVTVPQCIPRRPCGPPPCSVNRGYPQPGPCQFAPPCPAPMQRPMSCRPILKCAPPGPSVGPLPPCSTAPACGPNLPPALIEEYRYPQCEPQNLLSGIWNLPGQLIRNGRLTGDINRRPSCVPPVGW